MTNVYVRSGAAGAGTGADWANAYLTLAAALTAKSAGDDFWVSEDHAETQASVMTMTIPGTAASPNRIICVNHLGSVPPVSADLRTTATVSTTGSNAVSFASGWAYFYGITFTAGNSTGTANVNIVTGSTSTGLIFDTCKLALGGTNVSNVYNIGVDEAAVTSSAGFVLEFRNTTLSFANVGHTISPRGARFRWTNTVSAIQGSVPTTLFTANASRPQLEPYQIIGVDLSALGSGKNLVSIGSGLPGSFIFMDCKLGASVSAITGTIGSPGSLVVSIINCDSANTNYRYEKYRYQGTITQETTIVRTSGASDGTTPVSRKMVSTANAKFFNPLESDPILYWNESTSALTVKVPVITDNVTLKDNEAWIEVEYLGTSSFPLGVFDVSDRAADILNAGTNQTTDATSTWTTTGLTTPVKQVLSATFTPTGKGIIRVKVCLAKASTTMYFDPLLVVT